MRELSYCGSILHLGFPRSSKRTAVWLYIYDVFIISLYHTCISFPACKHSQVHDMYVLIKSHFSQDAHPWLNSDNTAKSASPPAILAWSTVSDSKLTAETTTTATGTRITATLTETTTNGNKSNNNNNLASDVRCI